MAQSSNTWRNRVMTAQPAQNADDVCQDILQRLMEHYRCGTISIDHLQKIRDLATNKQSLLAALAWL